MIDLNRRHKLNRKLIYGGLLSLFVSACAVTPGKTFQPSNKTVANIYYQAAIDENSGRISYEGNLFDSPEQVESYIIYRAAQMALQGGYDNFKLIMPDLSEDEKARHAVISPIDRKNKKDVYFRYSFFENDKGWSKIGIKSAFMNIDFKGRDALLIIPSGAISNSTQITSINHRNVTKSRVFAQVDFGYDAAFTEGRDVFDAQDVLAQKQGDFSFVNSNIIFPQSSAAKDSI
jgi:hypothetical protein